MIKLKVWSVIIKIKKNDELRGKRLYNSLFDFMMGAGISGATAVNAVGGFGRRGSSTLHIEGISLNYSYH